MQKLVKINKDKNIKISNQVIDFLNPEFVYIPIYKGYSLKIKDKSYIKKEQIVEETDKKIPIYSPISGVVAGGINKKKFNNRQIPTIAIENDYKEELFKKRAGVKNISNLNKDDLIKILSTMGTIDSDNGEELLYKVIEDHTNIKYLVIKCFDNEPYIENTYFELKNYAEIILETIDDLISILGCNKAILLMKNNFPDNIIKYNNYLGTYPKITIKLIDDLYPLNNDQIIKKEILKMKNDNNNLIIFSLQNILNIYNAVKRKRQITEKYITITGNAIENPCVINVKIGTQITEIIKNIIKIKEKDVTFITNGLLSGYEIDNINGLIVTNDFEGLIINKKVYTTPSKCINCGKCYNVCPMGLNPKNIDFSKCIRCGLCSYYCPAKIDLLRNSGDKYE